MSRQWGSPTLKNKCYEGNMCSSLLAIWL